jgi:putative transposase
MDYCAGWGNRSKCDGTPLPVLNIHLWGSVWERRFYTYGVYSEKKRLEKLNYMHNNQVKRGLVCSAEEWPWSSFRFYYLNDTSLLSMDKLV